MQWAYQQALGRPPQKGEISTLVDLFAKHLQKYQQDKDAAAQTLAVGDWPADKTIDPVELAAWTSVSRTILNLHETITRF